MAPLKAVAAKKSVGNVNSENSTVRPISTRSSKSISSTFKKENIKDINVFPKRKAASPIKGKTLKRSALGNITNAIETKCIIDSGKKASKNPSVSNLTKPTITSKAKISQAVTRKSPQQPLESKPIKSLLPPLPKSRLKAPVLPAGNSKLNVNAASLQQLSSKTQTAKSAAGVSDLVKSTTTKSPSVVKKTSNSVVPASKTKVTVKPKGMINPVPNTRRSSGRRSTFESSDSSLYVSALSDVLDDVTSSEKQEKTPKPVINIDEEYLKDPNQCATYAYEIFEYLKSREEYFKISEYMEKQPTLTPHVRSVLVDWMVEVQETFELNHETLYLGVKLVDTYLSKVKVSKTNIQLLGITAMLIAAKYDERIPPSIEEFCYICNEAYDRSDVLKMELNVLRVINFELGYPLSYRFLRRYARCAKVPMPLLTLARFILEFTLMDYSTITLSDSKMAAAALYLAFQMKKEQNWDDTLIYFTGYNVQDFIEVVHILNNSLHQKPRQSLSTVRNKYSHQIFYEVAKTPLVSSDEL